MTDLTIGKIYDGVEEDAEYYRIRDDSGEDYLYPKAMFKRVTQRMRVREVFRFGDGRTVIDGEPDPAGEPQIPAEVVVAVRGFSVGRVMLTGINLPRPNPERRHPVETTGELAWDHAAIAAGEVELLWLATSS